MTHGYCISSRVWWYDSRVLHILTGTEDMTHGYWWYDSRVLHILTGTEDMTHGYWWYYSRVMHTLTGTEDMTHGYWWYDSPVMHILMGTAYSLSRVSVHVSRNKFCNEIAGTKCCRWLIWIFCDMLQILEVTSYTCKRPRLLSHNSSEGVELQMWVGNYRWSPGLTFWFHSRCNIKKKCCAACVSKNIAHVTVTLSRGKWREL